MALNTRTWAEVLGLTQARAGAAFSGGTETTNIGFLLNSAARTIYDESRYWERYLVLEPRTASRGYIAITEDSYNVYGAGEANGLYVRNGDSNGVPAYTMYVNKVGIYSLRRTIILSSIFWQIVPGDPTSSASTIYSKASTSPTPPLDGWSVSGSGVSPAPIVQALSEIDEAMGYWDGAKWAGGDPTTLTAYPDQNGIRLANKVTGTVYVAFKKTWTDIYGNGTSGTVTTVPSEWAEFMAYDAARSYRASQGGEDGFNPIALRDVNNALERA